MNGNLTNSSDINNNSFTSRVIYISISSYIYYPITIIGLLMNIGTVLFIYKRNIFWKNNNTIGLFYATQIIFYSVALTFHIISRIITIELHNFNCRIKLNLFSFIEIYIFTVIDLYQLFLTLEKICHILYKKNTYNKHNKNQYRIILIILNLITSIPLLTLYILFLDSNYDILFQYCIYTEFNQNIFYLIILTFRGIPFILIFIFNFLLLFSLFKYGNRLDSVISLSKEYRLLITLLFINFTYLIFMFPYFLTLIYEFIYEKPFKNNAFNMFTKFLMILYCISPFIINYFFNSYFRTELKKTIMKRFKKR